METLYDFFIFVRNRLNCMDADFIEMDPKFYDSHPFIYEIEEFILHEYTSKIGDKLFSLPNSDRERYATCLINEFKRLFNEIFGNIREERELRIKYYIDKDKKTYKTYSLEDAEKENIKGESYQQLYCFRKGYGGLDGAVDIYPLMSDCYHFLYLLADIFAQAGINIKETIEKFDLKVIFSRNWEEIKINSPERNVRRIFNCQQITEAAQVLVIESILSELGIVINDNKSAVTDFFNFIAGKDMTPNPSGSNVYKRLGKADKKSKYYNRDCDVAADILNRVGLIGIAEKIIKGKKTKNEDN